MKGFREFVRSSMNEAAEYKFWRKITDLVDKLDPEDD